MAFTLGRCIKNTDIPSDVQRGHFMSYRQWAIITFIVLLGAFGRIYHINEQSLWVDEGYAFYHSHFPSLIETLARDTHPPLYFATLRLWSEITGQTELALRWLSVLPSILSLAVIFQLAKEVIRQRPINPNNVGVRYILPTRNLIPILATLMLALADAENYLAQESRHYTWLVLLTMSSMWLFLRWTRTQNRRDMAIWVALTTAMVYTHYISVFIGIVQGVYTLLMLRGKVRLQALGGLILSALLLSPWLIFVGVRQLGNDGANWSVQLSAEVIRDIQVKYFTEQWTLIFGLIILGCVTIIYIGQSDYRAKFHRVTVLLLLWLILPFALTVIVNEILPFLQPRRLTQWTPVIALLVAFGLGNIRQPIRMVLVAVLVIYGVTTVDFYRVKPDWRTISTLTARYALAGDLVLTDISGGDYQMQYYLTRELPDGKLLPDGVRYESLKLQRDFYAEDYHKWLPELLEDHNTVWLMYWSSDTSAFGWFDNLGFVQTAEFTYVHDGGADGDTVMSIFRFDRPVFEDYSQEFENHMRLLDSEFDPEDLRLDTLWTATNPIDRDYTISAKLLDENGVLVAQLDSQPQLNQRPTTTWQVDELIYSPHTLQLRDDLTALPAGEYDVALEIYYTDGSELVSIPSLSRTTLVILESVMLES